MSVGAVLDLLTDLIEDSVLFLQSLFLGPAPLPTISPVTDQKLEAKTVDSKRGLKADTKVGVVHFILALIGVKQA